MLSGLQEVVLVLELERVAEYWYTGIPDTDKVFGGARFALLCLGLTTFHPGDSVDFKSLCLYDPYYEVW